MLALAATRERAVRRRTVHFRFGGLKLLLSVPECWEVDGTAFNSTNPLNTRQLPVAQSVAITFPTFARRTYKTLKSSRAMANLTVADFPSTWFLPGQRWRQSVKTKGVIRAFILQQIFATKGVILGRPDERARKRCPDDRGPSFAIQFASDFCNTRWPDFIGFSGSLQNLPFMKPRALTRVLGRVR